MNNERKIWAFEVSEGGVAGKRESTEEGGRGGAEERLRESSQQK